MAVRREALFTKLFASAIEDGDIDSSIKPADAAGLVLALIQGLAMRWSLEKRGFDLAKEGTRLLEIQLKAMATA